MNSKSLTLLLIASAIGVVLVSLILLLLPNIGNSLASSLGLDNNFIASTPTLSGSLEKAKVHRVVDGDTVELSDGRKIRYLNVDTPETVKSGTAVMCYGLIAKEFNKKTVEDKEVWLLSDKEAQDRYNRDLRIVFLSFEDAQNKKVENSLSGELLKLGMAQEKSYSPNTTYRKVFQNIEKQAKNDQVGAWGQCPKPFVA